MILSELFKDTTALVARSKAGASLLAWPDLRLVLVVVVLVSAAFAALVCAGRTEWAEWVGITGLFCVHAYAAVRSVQRSAMIHRPRKAEPDARPASNG